MTSVSRRWLSVCAIVCIVLVLSPRVPAAAHVSAPQTAPVRLPIYDQLKAFQLGGGSAEVSNLSLKRDRIEMTFTGTFYFATPVSGQVTGAVFIGNGTLHSDVPPVEFERDNVQRLLGADAIESDFKTAVLRMTDDTFERIGQAPPPREAPPAPAPAQKLAAEFEPRLLKETGLNLSARLAASLVNHETPGVFFAQFDGGRRGRFSAVLDQQTRIPVSKFSINSGEKGLFFSYLPIISHNDVWAAFYLQKEYETGQSVYSDANDMIDITNYTLDVDVRDPARRLGVSARIDAVTRTAGVQAIPFNLGDGLGSYEDQGLKNQFHVTSASLDGQPLAVAQEPWESGFTVFLPSPAAEGAKLTLTVAYEGNFMFSHPLIPECFYLTVNDIWLPRHGYLDRATFDVTYHTAKRHKVAATGTRVSEAPDDANKDVTITKYKMDLPVALMAFAVGPFVRTAETLKFERGGEIPLEFNGTQKEIQTIGDDFIRGELNNSLRYFANMFGPYPYASFGAVFHPRAFGQGFATMLFIPNADRATLQTLQFISHETAHQWWGNIVAWRSYRDQWLSEGFAEYSAILFAAARGGPDGLHKLLVSAHDELLPAPQTLTGRGKGRLVDVGPIILGHRLTSSKSLGTYQALIYSKGALVLRMLDFLFQNPATGSDAAFRSMMRAFVTKYRNGTASSEDFFTVAGQQFAATATAQKYGLTDLKWFFTQWVKRSEFPSISLDYELKPQPDGKVVVHGTIRQDGVPADWFMPIPIVYVFDGNQIARTTAGARGPSTTFDLTLPKKPIKVELDPDSWLLADKLSVRGK